MNENPKKLAELFAKGDHSVGVELCKMLIRDGYYQNKHLIEEMLAQRAAYITSSSHLPEIVSRNYEDNQILERTSANSVALGPALWEHLFRMGGGEIAVESYLSLDDEDRGGIALKVTTRNEGPIPFARNIENGIEIHISGEEEAFGFVRTMLGVMMAIHRGDFGRFTKTYKENEKYRLEKQQEEIEESEENSFPEDMDELMGGIELL